MKFNQVLLRLTFAATVFAAQGAHAAVNLIDQTWGSGVGSFELGVFTPRGVGQNNFQSLLAGSTVLNGWSVGGVGVDWLGTPAYGANDGAHAIDLGYFVGGAGSVSIAVPTIVGATYAIDFMAAAVSGFPSYTNAGTVSAGSLSGAAFSVPFSDNFDGQVYQAVNFNFVATATSTVLSIAAYVPGTSYGPVIDKVSISFVSAPVPEPGTWALMVLGLGGIGAIRRLRH